MKLAKGQILDQVLVVIEIEIIMIDMINIIMNLNTMKVSDKLRLIIYESLVMTHYLNSYLGDYNFCRSTHAEERPFCVNSRDQKIECLKIKQCPGPGFVT